ncbi:MAG: hypothetical protein CV082_10480 [Candidatus Brocadia sp. BL1]|nr:MAG: hypothetical protein CV082_10480 [Candidatus Brocadia sp. BL1]
MVRQAHHARCNILSLPKDQPNDKGNLVAALLCYDINQSWLTRSGLNRVVENSIKLIPVKMKKGRRLPVIFI